MLSIVGAYFWLPESPKYLVSRKKYDLARDSINQIAKFNNKTGFYGNFDREIIDNKSFGRPVNFSTLENLRTSEIEQPLA